jgi:hypothetical protein
MNMMQESREDIDEVEVSNTTFQIQGSTAAGLTLF